MAGYTRQSRPDIINGAEITAPPLNAEFDQLEDSFSTTGHTHDGTAGNAPKINLQTSVDGYLLPINGGTGGKNNNQATSNPTITDDVDAGYAPGNIWLNKWKLIFLATELMLPLDLCPQRLKIIFQPTCRKSLPFIINITLSDMFFA